MTTQEIQTQLASTLAEREALIDAILAGRTTRTEDAPDWNSIALMVFTMVLIAVLLATHAMGLY